MLLVAGRQHVACISFVSSTAREAGAAIRNSAKYADLLHTHLFQPIALDTLAR